MTDDWFSSGMTDEELQEAIPLEDETHDEYGFNNDLVIVFTTSLPVSDDCGKQNRMIKFIIGCNFLDSNEVDGKIDIKNGEKCIAIGLDRSLFINQKAPMFLFKTIDALHKKMFKNSGYCIMVKSTDLQWKAIYVNKEDLTFTREKEIKKVVLYQRLEGFCNKIKRGLFESIDIENDIPKKFKGFYRNGGLVMRNIDSEVNLDDNILGYANMLTSSWLSDIKDICFPVSCDELSFIYPDMVPDFPILLKKETRSYEELWKDIDDKRLKRYQPTGKVLGYYKRDEQPICRGPHIVLCPEYIKDLSEKSRIPFNVLFAKVLIHELAHAIMDKYRILDNDGIMYTIEKENSPDSLEAKAMEESMANAITLACFKNFASEQDYKFVSHFVNNWQPTLYRFGLWQEHANVDWRLWRETTKQPTEALKKWFDTCFQDGNIKILLDDYSQEDYKMALSI